jgi:lipopolysaccharide biosynthesis glycosyltransferase
MTSIEKKCIVLVCDEGFLTPALFICQQLTSSFSLNFDIIIASGEDISHLVPKNIIFFHEKMDDFTNQLPEIPRLKKFAYWRIPVIQSLSKKYDKILYLDADVFITAPQQIEYLLNIDMGTNAIAAVRDVHQLTRPQRVSREHQSLKLPAIPYFNSGVLLINSSNWIKYDFFKKIVHLAKTHKNYLFCHDQSLLNLVTEGQWLELAPVWNWQYSRKNCLLTEMLSPNIIHFAGAIKLWHAPTGDIPEKYHRNYINYIKNNDIKNKLDYPFFDKILLRKWAVIFLKNLWYFNCYKRYIINFKNQLSTKAHLKVFDISKI